MKILIINGPNIQLLGKREPEVYGHATLDDLHKHLKCTAVELSVDIEFFQSNHEGDIVDRIAEAFNSGIDGIVINPAAYTHTSIAIHDALRGVNIPTVEVHISNILSRESFRHCSLTAPACLGVVAGLGIDGYEWAFRALVRRLVNKKTTHN
ncbi:MAG: type II 3-dehydroquinate dehydratase [Victivallaceae bacterium]